MASFLRRGRTRMRCAAAVMATGTVAATLLAVPDAAFAFCRTTTVPIPASYSPTRGCFTEGLPLFWRNACVSYSVNRAASKHIPLDQARPIIEHAFTTWTEAKCGEGNVGITASETDLVDCTEVRYNQNGPNQNVILFRDDSWPYNDPNNTLGLTTVTFDADSGEIYDADMEINASAGNLVLGDPVPSNGFDLLSVITHEVGHFFGLAHATDPKSTMYASYKPGTTSLRTLTDDDVAGVCAIYPTASTRSVASTVSAGGTAAADACDPVPRHGFGTTCAENPSPNESSGCSVASVAPSRSGSAGAVAVVFGVVAAFAGASFVRRRRARRI